MWVCGLVNACKSSVYKPKEALKGRPDVKHGCNPCAETPARHGRSPRAPRAILLLLALLAIATTAQAQTYTGATINNVNYKFYDDGTASVEPSPDAYGTINLVETLNYNSTTYTLTRISANAFHGLTTISSVTIPNTVTEIGGDAFSGCTGLTGTLTLPTALQHIGNNAFRRCTGLTGALNLPDGLLTIGSCAFYQCAGFTGQLNLPATLTSIGYAAFSNCTGFSGTLTLPPLLTEIGESTFYGIQFTGGLTVPDGVRSIERYAFANNSSLSAVTLGVNVENIGVAAFAICTSLSSITIGDNVTIIDQLAFRSCTSLNTVVLGEDLQSIWHNAFNGCTALSSITSKNPTPPALGNNVFLDVPASAVLYVPCQAKDAYAAATGWKVFRNMYGLANPVLVDYLYYTLCDGTATVVRGPCYDTLVGANIDVTVHFNGTDYPVVGIEAGTFDGCTNLLSFDCHFTLTELGDHTFRGCTSLLSVGLYNTDTPPTLGEGVFEGLNLSEMFLEVPSCTEQEYIQHATFGQFGNILGQGNCGYKFTNQNGNGDKKWTTAANWEGGEVPGEDARVGIFGDCEIDADVTIGSITINHFIDEVYGYYDRLTVKDGATLTVTNFIYNSGDERNFVVEDGAQAILPNTGAKATVQKEITAYSTETGVNNGWHPSAIPSRAAARWPTWTTSWPTITTFIITTSRRITGATKRTPTTVSPHWMPQMATSMPTAPMSPSD